jgi:hypothetical protein
MVKGITYILANDSKVQALVGRNQGDTKYKVYPNICAQPEKFPYVVVRQSGKVPIDCKGSVPTTYEYRYDVMSFHKSYDDCEQLDDAVVEALIKLEGGTFNTVIFQDIRHVNTVDQYADVYQMHVKVSSFEAMVNEDQAT